jgi:hypothetical protein
MHARWLADRGSRALVAPLPTSFAPIGTGPDAAVAS